MTDEPRSIQTQTPLADAQDSVEKTENAVKQAQSHPSERMIDQAQHSMNHAQQAVSSALQDENGDAVAQVQDRLTNAGTRLRQLPPVRTARPDETP